MRAGALALVAVVFQGCSGDDDDTGSNGGKGGTGGKSSGGTAGKGGTPGGGKSGQGGSGGAHAGGSGKGGSTAGHGGSTAGRGGSNHGGAGQAGAGEGGGGSGNVIPSDPGCHCVEVEVDGSDPQFSCSMTLEAAQDAAPAVSTLCDIPDTDVGPNRFSCDSGGHLYHWEIFNENSVDVQRDNHGDVVYLHAFGFQGVIPTCGVSWDYQVGEVFAGEPVGTCTADECSVCDSNGNGQAGAAGAGGRSGAGGEGGGLGLCSSP